MIINPEIYMPFSHTFKGIFFVLVICLAFLNSSCSMQTMYVNVTEELSEAASEDDQQIVAGEDFFEDEGNLPADEQNDTLSDSGESTQDVSNNAASPTLFLSPTPSGTPTPDTRLKPEQWRSWPVVPEFSLWLIDFFKHGQELGRDRHAFSRVGDCQNIPEAFLGLYATERYYFSDRYAYLQETVDYFVGSFGRENISVHGGFNFPAVFSPLRADPDACEVTENPIECELRVHNPAFVFISLEFVYEGRTADNYEEYLRSAVEYTLSLGVIPILATKADNVEGDHSINLATAQVAYDYDVPMWNWWKAAQRLPNKGMDVERNDGFHISSEAWSERTYTALQTLDTLLRFLGELEQQ
jgi:hypothetical protein